VAVPLGEAAIKQANNVVAVEMSRLTRDPFNFQPYEKIYLYVRAKNSRGWSELSPASRGKRLEIAPSQIPFPNIETKQLADGKQMYIFDWDRPDWKKSGGSRITKYIIYWDEGITGSEVNSVLAETKISEYKRTSGF
jgi:hypothetical protein